MRSLEGSGREVPLFTSGGLGLGLGLGLKNLVLFTSLMSINSITERYEAYITSCNRMYPPSYGLQGC